MRARGPLYGRIVNTFLNNILLDIKYKKFESDAGSEAKSKLYNEALDEGMNHIDEKGYCKPFVGSGKAVYKAVFAFLGRSDVEMSCEQVGANVQS